MPQITELRQIDGALWARIPVTGDEGCVQIMSEAEIEEQSRKATSMLDEITRLRERCQAYKGQVECGAAEIERLRGAYEIQMRKTDATEATAERLRAGLDAAVRAAELALFVIRKQNVMPNSSWQAGFEKDMAAAKSARGADEQKASLDGA